MQVTLDTYSNFYDGKNLAAPRVIQKIWETSVSGGSAQEADAQDAPDAAAEEQ